MLKIRDKILFMLMFLFVQHACQENKTMMKDVLLNNITDIVENRIDSIALEYTYLDSITQRVKRTFYSKTMIQPYSFDYKIINKKTKVYIELPYDTLKSIYLNTETFDIVSRYFNVPTLNFDGRLKYRYNIKDSISNINYSVFQGNDVGFSRNMDGYFYFDSIFHLKKIYNNEGVLLFSVN